MRQGWGETGLDFNRMFSPQKDQEACLRAQLAIAETLDLPLIFHERDSRGRFYDIVKSDGPASRKGVIHCFSGTREEMFQYLDLGYHIGITGILTIRKRGRLLRELAPLIPEDRILIETDAPYLTPAPQKNKVRRNEPAFVYSVLITLAQIRNQDPTTWPSPFSTTLTGFSAPVSPDQAFTSLFREITCPFGPGAPGAGFSVTKTVLSGINNPARRDTA